jgi:hypothetical protein
MGPSFSFSTRVLGMSMPARKPTAIEPTARPSGFCCATLAPFLAACFTSPVLGVFSFTVPAASEAPPAILSLTPVMAPVTPLTLSLTASLVRDGTSAL